MPLELDDCGGPDGRGELECIVRRRDRHGPQPRPLLLEPYARDHVRRARRTLRVALVHPRVELLEQILLIVELSRALKKLPFTQPTRFSTEPFWLPRAGAQSSGANR